MTFKEKYNKLKLKYSLPEYNELNINFDIEEISDESELILNKIRVKIREKIEFYANLIESIVQPEPNLTNMYQLKHIDDNTKEEAFLLFKKLSCIVRYSNLVSVHNSEEENAEFIIESYNQFTKLKPDIERHMRMLSNIWKKETNIKNDMSYFG